MESNLALNRVKPFKSWVNNKLLVMHMNAPHLDVEIQLRANRIPFVAVAYDDPNLDELLDSKLSECFGIIISGSRDTSIRTSSKIFESKLPKLGLCYGNEELGSYLGSEIINCNDSIGEYSEVIAHLYPSILFEGLDITEDQMVFMAHSYMLASLPRGCRLIAETKETPIAGFENLDIGVFGLQFHPEKSWTDGIPFRNFYKFCERFNA
jgi:GMP synthase-like glutamine amidotransferase